MAKTAHVIMEKQLQSPLNFTGLDTEEVKSMKIAEKKLITILDNPQYLRKNKELLLRFIRFLQTKTDKNGQALKPRTYLRHIYLYEKIMDCLDKKLYLLDAKKPDIERMIAKVNTLGIGDLTKSQLKLTTKMIFKHELGQDEFTPIVVGKWLSTSAQPKRQLTDSSLYSPEEIKAIIQNSGNSRNAAVCALILDCPLRPEEVIHCTRGSLNLDSATPYIKVMSKKTGNSREVYLADSISHLAAYINTTHFDSDRDPLFWKYTWSKEGGAMTYAGMRKMFIETCKRAGIAKNKRYLYCARHTVISNLSQAGGLDIADLEDQAGWVRGGWADNSKTYVHANSAKRASNIRRIKGIEDSVEDSKLKSKLISCWRCKKSGLSNDNIYCPICSAPLSKDAYQRFDDIEIAKVSLAKYLSSSTPDKFIEELAKLVETMKKQREETKP